MKHGLLFAAAAVVSSTALSIAIVSGGVSAATVKTHKVCASVRAGNARCFASILTDGSGVTPLISGGTGYKPADFRNAYNVHGNAATHVAIVTAYDAPRIQADVATFSQANGLPSLPTCTATNQPGCLEKVNQTGGSSLPAGNQGWALETSLDVESLHGMCPSCHISLVEAATPSMTNLSTAANTAASLGATVISNSYGGSEASNEINYDGRYHHAGVNVIVSSGDSGYGTTYPAASPFAVAVGGTSLKMSGSRVTSESAWSGAGSGCSQYEPKPAWQTDKKCSSRSIADVAADADPETGAAIYDSYGESGKAGWFTVGGTSLAAPLVAGMIANSGNTSSQPAYFYGNGSAVRDISSGSNGSCTSYLCKAVAGYDGPTGLGVVSRL